MKHPIRVPLPKQTESAFRDKSKYNRSDKLSDIDTDLIFSKIISTVKVNEYYDCQVEYNSNVGYKTIIRKIMGECEYREFKFKEKVKNILSNQLLEELDTLLDLKYSEGYESSKGYED